MEPFNPNRRSDERPSRPRNNLLRPAATVAAGAGIALVVFVLGIAARASQIEQPASASIVVVDPHSTAVDTAIVGVSPGLRAAIRQSLAGVGKTSITRVAVTPFGSSGGVALRFTFSPGGDPARHSAIYSEWQAGLVSTATRDRARDRRLEPVLAYYVTSGGGVIEGRPVRVPPQPTAASLIGRVRRIAAGLGASLVKATVLRPRGVAMAVVLDVNDPARFLRSDSKFEYRAFPKQTPHGNGLDGTYVEVRTGGRVVYINALNNRMLSGSGWIDPRFSGCVNLPTAIGGQTPSCPVH
jgi:hypothetical protein